jgi:hypothetical protein
LFSLEEDVDDPDDAAAIGAQIALVDQMLMEKTESYVSVIRSLESMAAARKAESDRLKDRAKTAEAHAEWLKARLLTHLKVAGRDRVEMARFTLTVRQNPLHVEVLEAMLVPPEYQKTVITTSVDKRAILDTYKRNGEMVPGVEIGRTERLQIS